MKKRKFLEKNRKRKRIKSTILKRRILWNEFVNKTRELCSKIQAEFKPDIIVGIIRGGLVPTRLMSSILGVKKIHNIHVIKIGDKRKVLGKIPFNIKGKNILLVEDMLETGRSLIVARDYLQKHKANVKTVAYYLQPQTEIIPDFYLKKVRKKITFPWEI